MPDPAGCRRVVTTEGHLLGGRVIYRQPKVGFRSGLEPVLLAASVAARPGDEVLEAGTGAGAALLCLSARIPGVRVTGVEVDAAMAELASANAHANGFADMTIIHERIETAALRAGFDHAIANPPYHGPHGTASPIGARETAKRGSDTLLSTWIARLSGALRDRGDLTLIVPSGSVPACLAAMAQSRCPCTSLFLLWPRQGRAAKLVLLRGIRNGRTPMRLMPGLVLHDPDGSFTEAAMSILGHGSELSLEEDRPDDRPPV